MLRTSKRSTAQLKHEKSALRFWRRAANCIQSRRPITTIFYARDLIHHHGMGKHDGEPCDSPTISALPPANRLAWKDDCGAGGCGADLQQITLAALNAITGGSGGPPPPGPSSG